MTLLRSNSCSTITVEEFDGLMQSKNKNDIISEEGRHIFDAYNVKLFYEEFHHYMSKLSHSHINFYKLFYDVTLNDHYLYILDNFMKSYISCPSSKELDKLYSLELISINNEISIGQFIIDVYTQYVLKENITINQFIEKIKLLSIIPKYCKPYNIIRQYMSKYLKYIYLPINKSIVGDDTDDDDDDDEENNYNKPLSPSSLHHNLFGILHYTSTIHNYLRYHRKINCGNFLDIKMHQIDVIFVPHNIPWINCKYFRKHGITFLKLNRFNNKKDENDIFKMIRQFDEINDTKLYSRCIILIINKNNNMMDDEIYIFQPLNDNSLLTTKEICNYSELPWIYNSKLNILPNLSPNQHNILILSFHLHPNAERVYFHYGTSYSTRIMKHNLIDAISPFCTNTNDSNCNLKWWKNEINNMEFTDHKYDTFINTYFVDLRYAK